MFLAAAYESSADYIVSYDQKSLLSLKHSHGTPIRTPELFLLALLLSSAEEAHDEKHALFL
jgi:predicted nucleic acid-binding protein